MAGSGRAAREATSVAMALAASWKPFENANASAMPIAAIKTKSTASSSPSTSAAGVARSSDYHELNFPTRRR